MCGEGMTVSVWLWFAFFWWPRPQRVLSRTFWPRVSLGLKSVCLVCCLLNSWAVLYFVLFLCDLGIHLLSGEIQQSFSLLWLSVSSLFLLLLRHFLISCNPLYPSCSYFLTVRALLKSRCRCLYLDCVYPVTSSSSFRFCLTLRSLIHSNWFLWSDRGPALAFLLWWISWFPSIV